MSLSYKVIFLLIALPLFALSQGEKHIDSLLASYKGQNDDSLKVNTINGLYNAFLYTDSQKAKQYANEALILSKKINFKTVSC